MNIAAYTIFEDFELSFIHENEPLKKLWIFFQYLFHRSCEGKPFFALSLFSKGF
jgi:hypothetical protein